MWSKGPIIVLVAVLVTAVAGTAAAETPPPPGHARAFALPVIEVLDPSGVMTAPFVTTAFGKLEPELMRCASSTKWTGDAMAWIVTDWRGKATKVELAIDSASVEKCFVKTVKKLVVAHAQARSTVFVRLRIEAIHDAGPPQ